MTATADPPERRVKGMLMLSLSPDLSVYIYIYAGELVFGTTFWPFKS